MSERDPEAWKVVYEATNPAELAAAYADWSGHYDRETMQLGYCLPFMVTAWLARYVPRGAGPVLDAGCGTGLPGRWCGRSATTGWRASTCRRTCCGSPGRAAPMPISEQAELGKALPWPDRYFSAFFSTGVFTEGHAPASGLDELVRITRQGGHAIVTVRDILLERLGFREKFAALERGGQWRQVEESGLFRAFVVAEPETLIKTFVFEIL